MSSEEHMLGHGYYNKHAQAQGAANQHAVEIIARAVQALDLSRLGREIRIADYGCAQGHNSLLPIRAALEALAARGAVEAAATATVIHTDLPTNDWTTLFETVLTSADSYVAGRPGVSVFAGGTSIYERIFPPGHIALGYSAITNHWLSRIPSAIPDHIWSARATGAVRQRWATQARRDWYDFLRHRATELVAGGQVVMVNSGADAAGRSGAEPLVEAANAALLELVRDGTLGAQEYAGMAIPTYYRTEREWREPFEDAAFVSEHPLILRSYREFAMDDVYLAEYARTLDASAFAESDTAFFRAAFEPVLLAGVRAARGEEVAQKVGEALARKLADTLACDPEGHAARWVLQVMWVAREDG
jgi:hypothetical protein